MLSKDWKLALVLPIIAIALSACSNKKTASSSDSPFAGVWVNQQALSDYRTLRFQPREFCTAVQSNPAVFGVSGGTPQFEKIALMIRGGGEIYNYSWQSFNAQAGYHENYRHGRVDRSGRFEDQIFTRSGNTLTRQRISSERAVLYLSSSPEECRAFEDAILRCENWQRSGGSDWNGQPNWQDQPQQRQPVPPNQQAPQGQRSPLGYGLDQYSQGAQGQSQSQSNEFGPLDDNEN